MLTQLFIKIIVWKWKISLNDLLVNTSKLGIFVLVSSVISKICVLTESSVWTVHVCLQTV